MNLADFAGLLDMAGFQGVKMLAAFAWQSSILLAAAALLDWFLVRRRPSARCAIWVAAVLLLPAMPLVTWAAGNAGAPQAPIEVLPVYDGPHMLPSMPANEDDASTGAASRSSRMEAARFSFLNCPWAFALIAYALGATLMTLTVAVGRLRIGRIARSARPESDERVMAAFAQAARHLRVRRRPSVRISPCVDAPITLGTLRPAVVVPRGFGQATPPADLLRVALHETAHVKRLDAAVFGIASIIRAILFFHPLVWLACRRISLLAEQAADDAVVDTTGAPVAYAGMLARLAEGLTRPSFPVSLATGLVFSRSAFVVRARAILSDNRASMRKLSGVALVMIAAAVGASLLVAAGLPIADSVKAAAPAPSDAKAQEGAEVQTYDVNVPAAWESKIGVGKLSLIGYPFYSAPFASWICPANRVTLPVKNLTAAPLYFYMSLRTESKDSQHGNTEIGAIYAIGPGEARVISTLAPVSSVKRPVIFKVRMALFDAPPKRVQNFVNVLVVDPFTFPEPAAPGERLQAVTSVDENIEVKETHLLRSDKEGNVLQVAVHNRAESEIPLKITVNVGDPGGVEQPLSKRYRLQDEFSRELTMAVPGKSDATFTIPYEMRDSQSDIALAFALFEVPREVATYEAEYDPRKNDRTLVSWGLVNLREAAKRGECAVTPTVPVEERANLTGETRSEHFLFCYRPGSFAQKQIERIVREREKAYADLKAALKMDLPQVVEIDLYPDMEAKGFGSKTPGNPANTVNDHQIAEVYSEAGRVDEYHEIAHLFSYRFPGTVGLGSRGGLPVDGLVEGFAQSFPLDNQADSVKYTHAALAEGRLPKLGDMLLASVSSRAHEALVHFLLKKDVEKFKAFYVRLTAASSEDHFLESEDAAKFKEFKARSAGGGEKDVEQAAKEVYGKSAAQLDSEWKAHMKQETENAPKDIYGMTLDQLEREWHDWLSQAAK